MVIGNKENISSIGVENKGVKVQVLQYKGCVIVLGIFCEVFLSCFMELIRKQYPI